MAIGSPTRLALLAMVLIGASAVTGWVLDEDEKPTKVVNAASDVWQLPKWQPPVTEAPLRLLQSRQPWGPEQPAIDPAAAAAASPPPPAIIPTPTVWHLVGIINETHGSLLILMVKEPGQGVFSPRYRHVGEQLPDGSTIKAIAGNGITIDANGKAQFITLFPLNI